MADAEAICAAVTRPNMKFVKSVGPQAVLMVHRASDLLVRQCTILINAGRAQMAKYCHVAARGSSNIRDLLVDLEDDRFIFTATARAALPCLVRQMIVLMPRLPVSSKKYNSGTRQPKIGRDTSGRSAHSNCTGSDRADPSHFRSARQFAALLGLVLRQNSSGGKERLGRITMMGDAYLRKLLVVGATAVLRHAIRAKTRTGEWIGRLLERKPARLVSVALANKTARIA